MAAISIRELTKVYATGVKALDALDLDVADGEFVVLVGPSGCGKTTALRMVAGLERITSGTISFGDRVVNDVSPRHRDVAMVFQNYALYPHLSVYQNIGFALENKKVERAERDRRIRDAAAILGLGELLGRKPKQLSGGQRQAEAGEDLGHLRSCQRWLPSGGCCPLRRPSWSASRWRSILRVLRRARGFSGSSCRRSRRS